MKNTEFGVQLQQRLRARRLQRRLGKCCTQGCIEHFRVQGTHGCLATAGDMEGTPSLVQSVRGALRFRRLWGCSSAENVHSWAT
mmetsp:Transcript_956/g.755  ORF Transcript_956/g.755 Transcript_956/m.755 type:complete len:84 (+) Transcript_956:3-254(+)